MSRKSISQYYGIILGAMAILTHILIGQFSYSSINKIYTIGLYPVWKWLLWPLQWLPFPSLFLFLAIGILLLSIAILKAKRILTKNSLLKALNVLGLIAFFFYVLWGFNYRTAPVKERLHLPSIEADSMSFVHLYWDISDQMLHERKRLGEGFAQQFLQDIPELSVEIDSLQRIWLGKLGYPNSIPAKVRPLPAGFLLRISTAGFYFPFGGEGYYDSGLHPITIPFVIAHELAHNYGVTDEGEANFVAFRTCLLSDHPYIRYSALLDFWRYLAASYRGLYPEDYQLVRDSLPDIIVQDLEAIRAQHDRYPDIFPAIRDKIYSTYLQSQGVRAGLHSYAEIIELELAYRKQYPSRK